MTGVSFIEGADSIAKSKLIIDDTPGISIAELRSKCRKYKMENNLGLIIIDYLQLMSGSGSGRSEGRQQEVSDISRALKALARVKCTSSNTFAVKPCSRAETRPQTYAFGSSRVRSYRAGCRRCYVSLQR